MNFQETRLNFLRKPLPLSRIFQFFPALQIPLLPPFNPVSESSQVRASVTVITGTVDFPRFKIQIRSQKYQVFNRSFVIVTGSGAVFSGKVSRCRLVIWNDQTAWLREKKESWIPPLVARKVSLIGNGNARLLLGNLHY